MREGGRERGREDVDRASGRRVGVDSHEKPAVRPKAAASLGQQPARGTSGTAPSPPPQPYPAKRDWGLHSRALGQGVPFRSLSITWVGFKLAPIWWQAGVLRLATSSLKPVLVINGATSFTHLLT